MANLIVMTASDYSDGSMEKSILEPLGAELRIVNCKTESDVIDAAHDALGILVTYTPIREKAMASLKKLKIIVRCGIGVDNLDLEAARNHGIKICNVPDYCLNEVADHAFAMLLSLERRLLMQSLDIRKGEWKGISAVKDTRGLQGAVLGIVGLGQIGRKLATRALPFGMNVIAYDPYVDPKDVLSTNITMCSFDDLLSRSDFISLHPPLTEENFHMFNSETIAKMKSSAFLINTSRGPLIDRVALLEAIKEKRIAGAGLDVVEDDLVGTRELSKFDNVINTPHTAWYSQFSFNELRRKSAEEIAHFLQDKPLLHPLV